MDGEGHGGLPAPSLPRGMAGAGMGVGVIPDCDALRAMVEEGGIVSMKQPIVSIKERRMVGYEALSRGVEADSGSLIPPDLLFGAAEAWGMSVAVDRACRKKAIEEFARWRGAGEPLLFLNFDPTILAQVSIGSGWMKDQVMRHGIAPSSVAIEIVESRVPSARDLDRFVAFYRAAGFLIVLDDFGSEHSNLNRVLQVKPDLIKIDRALVHNISKDFYKRAIVETIINLASKIGALSLAEGVEELEDILVCHELGADLYQGFYFAKPLAAMTAVPDSLGRQLEDLGRAAGDRQSERIAKTTAIHRSFAVTVDGIAATLTGSEIASFDALLHALSGLSPRVECLYILNADGIQVSRTHGLRERAKPARSALFRPSERGADHSLKGYFSLMRELHLTRYDSDPYISLATGSLCRTLVRQFVTATGQRFIVCVDFSLREEGAIQGGEVDAAAVGPSRGASLLP